ncbi:MAG: hypothetical protein SGJ03_16375 [Alphaproteobacteria bacterium]|nr:hypothetical protein [Alphaproteobacteria bacterium]
MSNNNGQSDKTVASRHRQPISRLQLTRHFNYVIEQPIPELFMELLHDLDECEELKGK